MSLMSSPLVVLIGSLVALWAAAEVGDILRKKVRALSEAERSDYGVVLSATLTLLGLLIAFTFSMATNRYDQRKACEEAEANAIGTEYLRADLLPEVDASSVRRLLKRYVDERVSFYRVRGQGELGAIAAETAELQTELWSAVRPRPPLQVTVGSGLAISGMNDVFNSQGYTEAAWRNRIPVASWVLMAVIAMCCSGMIGYGAHRKDWRIFLIVPVAVAIAFFLISDIDSPRGGFIRVAPENLLSAAQALHAQSG
jgi:hypothetical protein